MQPGLHCIIVLVHDEETNRLSHKVTNFEPPISDICPAGQGINAIEAADNASGTLEDGYVTRRRRTR
jgi:hypothetical protein